MATRTYYMLNLIKPETEKTEMGAGLVCVGEDLLFFLLVSSHLGIKD
jgi:hypothetical protein